MSLNFDTTTWSVSTTSSKVLYNPFCVGEDTFRSVEGFNYGWDNSNYVVDIPLDVLGLALFNTTSSFEGFESGWAGIYLDTLSPAVQEPANLSPDFEVVESFDLGWNTTYLNNLGPVFTADFSGTVIPNEMFETTWNNSSYTTNLLTTEFATFAGGTVVDFENVREKTKVLSFSIAGDTVILGAGHPYLLGDIVTFENEQNGIQSDILEDVEYLVTNPEPTSIKITNSAGTAVQITDTRQSFGTTFVVADRNLYWVDLLR